MRKDNKTEIFGREMVKSMQSGTCSPHIVEYQAKDCPQTSLLKALILAMTDCDPHKRVTTRHALVEIQKLRNLKSMYLYITKYHIRYCKNYITVLF